MFTLFFPNKVNSQLFSFLKSHLIRNTILEFAIHFYFLYSEVGLYSGAKASVNC